MFKEIFDYINQRKKFLLIPVFLVLILLILVIFLSESSSMKTAFIYTTF